MTIRPLLVAVLFLSAPVARASAPIQDAAGRDAFSLRVSAVVHAYWHRVDARLAWLSRPSTSSAASHDRARDSLERSSFELAQEVQSSLAHDRSKLDQLSGIYRSYETAARRALYPALRYLRIEAAHSGGPLAGRGVFENYFPGYGYAEPGFAYRKGREVAREHKGTTWVEENRTITASGSVELVIDISLIPHLRQLESEGVIRNLKIGEPFETRTSVKATFQASQTIVIKAKRKFDVEKIWFELLRAKGDPWWTTTPWEVCGRTYEIVNEPTGDTIVLAVHRQAASDPSGASRGSVSRG